MALGELIGHAAARRRRVRRHGRLSAAREPWAAAQSLEREGYAVLRAELPVQDVDRARREAEAAIDGRRLTLASRARPSDAELAAFRTNADQGEAAIAAAHSMVYVEDPLLNCPSALTLVFAEPLLELASAYYGCPAAIVSPKVVKSYANDVASSVHCFHVDYRRVKYLKFFIYLNDVDDHGGPFCFVAGSHLRKPRAWRRHSFEWTADEIRAFYGKGAIKRLTGRRGDLIVADTRGFHRGVKARARDRLMLKGATGVQPPEGPLPRLAREELHRLSARQQAAADFFVRV